MLIKYVYSYEFIFSSKCFYGSLTGVLQPEIMIIIKILTMQVCNDVHSFESRRNEIRKYILPKNKME